MKILIQIFSFFVFHLAIYCEDYKSEFLTFIDYFVLRVGFGRGVCIYWNNVACGIGIGKYVWYKKLYKERGCLKNG